MPLSGQIGLHANLQHAGTTVLGSAPSYPLGFSDNWDVLSGNGAGQAEDEYVAERVIGSGANDDLDLTGASLQNVFGQALAFVKIKAIIIKSLDANTTNLTVGNATSAFQGPFGAGTHTLVLTPGDCFGIWKKAAAGWAVGAGASDILRIANAAGASATYRIVLIGTRT